MNTLVQTVQTIIDAWRQLILAQNTSPFRIFYETEQEHLNEAEMLFQIAISPEFAEEFKVNWNSECQFTFYPGNRCRIDLNPITTDSDLNPEHFPKYNKAVTDKVDLHAQPVDWGTAFKVICTLTRALCDDLLILPPVPGEDYPDW